MGRPKLSADEPRTEQFTVALNRVEKEFIMRLSRDTGMPLAVVGRHRMTTDENIILVPEINREIAADLRALKINLIEFSLVFDEFLPDEELTAVFRSLIARLDDKLSKLMFVDDAGL